MDIKLSGGAAIIGIALVIGLPTLVVMMIFASISKRYKKFRFQQDQTIVAEYQAPESLSPAEIGYLFGFKSSLSEIYGTIFDLQRRGFLQVIRRGGNLVVATLEVDPSRLKLHEKYIFGQFVTQKQLNNLGASELLLPFSQTIRQQLEVAGYLTGSVVSHYFKVVYRTALLLILVFPGCLLFFGHVAQFIPVIILFAIFFGLIVYAPLALLLAWWYTRFAGHAWMGTKKLRAVWPGLLGYQSYIQLAELDRIKYSSSDLEQVCKNNNFAYAVAFGFNTAWQKFDNGTT